jgi:hypothetical protein
VPWFGALANQSRQLDTALAQSNRPSTALRRVVQFALDTRWPFTSRERYADTVGRLAELGFTEVTVHWSRPDGRGLPSDAISAVLDVHGL